MLAALVLACGGTSGGAGDDDGTDSGSADAGRDTGDLGEGDDDDDADGTATTSGTTGEPQADDDDDDTGNGTGDGTTGGEPEIPFPPDSTPTVFPTAEHRLDNWTPAGPWEMQWDGTASAADLPRPYHTWFDNPHDDDLNADPTGRGACKYRFDDLADGMPTPWAR